MIHRFAAVVAVPAAVIAAVAVTFTQPAQAQKTMYPVPKGALEVRYDALQPGIYEQDSFVIDQPYPSEIALQHYQRLFAGWRQCAAEGSQWQSFGDMSSSERKYHHQLIRHWVDQGNGIAVTVALRYTSKGSNARSRPDNSLQRVTVLRLKTKNATEVVEKMGVVCG
jgi:hypothetical protein